MHSRAIEIRRGRRPVIVRPLADGDTATAAAVLGRSSTAGTDVDAAALATVDSSRHALVAYAVGDPQPAAIGQLARVSPTGCEISLVVADRHVGTGLDDALAELLAADARAAGLSVPTRPAANEAVTFGAWRRLVRAATSVAA